MFKHIMVVPAVLLAVSATPQPLTFQKTIGGPNDEVAYSVQQTTDGGYVIAGYTKSYGPGSFENAYLVKIDSLGDVEWTKTYGTAGGASKARCARQTSDGGYIMAGYIYQSAATGYDVLLVKTDANGNAQWSKTIGGMGADSATSVESTSDGGYILCGTTNSYGAGENQLYLVKTNSSGGIIWTNTGVWYDSSVSNYVSLWGYEAWPTNDGGYLALSCFGNFTKTTATGQPLLLNYIGAGGGIGNIFEKACSARPLSGGGYIIASRGAWSGGVDISLAHTDSNFNGLWLKNFGSTGDDYVSGVGETQDKGFVIGGTSYSFGLGDADVYMFRTDSIGTLLWSKAYGGAADDICHGIEQTKDGGFIAAGSTRSFGNGADIYLIKTDALGSSGCHQKSASTSTNAGSTITTTINLVPNTGGVQNPITTTISTGGTDSTLCSSITSLEEVFVQHEDAIAYPNPADNVFTIEYGKAGSFQLTDMLGRMLLSRVTEAGQNNITINTSFFPSGVYVYRITDKAGRQQAGKVVIAH